MKESQKRNKAAEKMGRILLPSSQERPLICQKLAAAGAEVLCFPVYEEKPFVKNNRLGQALSEIESYSWVAFSNEMAVTIFFEALLSRRIDIRQLNRIKFAALAPEVRDAIEQRGVLVEYMPLSGSLEAFARGICKRAVKKERLLFPGIESRPSFCSVLEGEGHGYDLIPLWESRKISATPVSVRPEDILVFVNRIALCGFVSLMEDTSNLAGIRAICLDEQTAEEARKNGFLVTQANEMSLVQKAQELLSLSSGGGIS